MIKLTANAIGMMLAKYRAIFKNCFLKNTAFLAVVALICCAAPATATDYTVGGFGPNNYSTLEELRQDVTGNFADGDTITMYTSDKSLADMLSFGGKNVTINFLDRIVIKPSATEPADIKSFLDLSGGEVTFVNATKAAVSGFKRSATGSDTVEVNGGAIYLNSSKLNAQGAIFTSNSASASASGSGNGYGNGGAIHLNSSELNAQGAIFTSNSVSASASGSGNGYGNGGAVYLNSSKLDANGAAFTSNSASGSSSGDRYGNGYGNGGAVYLNSSKLDANGAAFTSNSASGSSDGYGNGYGYGGAVYLKGESTLNAERARFESNSAEGLEKGKGHGSGGAAYLTGSTLNAECAIFESNSAKGSDKGKGNGAGGAVYLESGSKLNANGARFESNIAKGIGDNYGSGGAVYVNFNSTFNAAEKAIFIKNSAIGVASGAGGAVYVYNSALNVQGATFELNSAEGTSSESGVGRGIGYGGALYLTSSRESDDRKLNAEKAIFRSNSAKGSGDGSYGGAVYLTSSDLNTKGAIFTSNSAKGSGYGGYGGAVYLQDKSELDAEGAIFESNSAAGDGKLFFRGGGYGGAVYVKNSTLNAHGATFLNNTATIAGGAIYSSAVSSSNTINLGADAGQVSLFEGNKANEQENSIYFDGGSGRTNILIVSGEGTLDMLDPINSSDNNYNINITKTGTGTWKLDGKNEFNATGTDGTTFTVTEGTLELYEDASITIEKGSFSLGEEAVLSVIAGKNPAVSAYSVDFNPNSTLNVSGYNGSQEGDTVTLIQSVTEIAKLTNYYTIDGNTSVDYLSAQIRLSNDKDKFEDDKYKYGILADVALTWYDNRQNPSDPDTHYDHAHGTFTVNGNFELGTGLEDRTGTFTTEWDGKTLTKKGAGTLILTGNNTYTGDTVIEGGTLTIKNAKSLGSKGKILNNGVLNLFASSDRGTTYNINSYSGSDAGVVGIKAALTAEEQWSDLLNFTNTPQSVNVHFYFVDGSATMYLPDDGLQFAHLSTTGTNNTFALNGISSLAGASELVITTSDYQDYFLTATFNPSLAKVYSKASAGELAQASWMHNRELFKATSEASRQADKDAPGIYAGFGRNDLRHETGSYADIKGNTLTLALALQAGDKTAWGIFGRKFDGSYRTSHRASLANGDYTVHSDGDLKTHDVGLFAEYRPQGETENGYYYQAIVRGGRSTNDFSTYTSYGPSTFRSGRSLYGFSLGGGYAAGIGRGKTADYYSHLIYTKLDGDNVTDSIKQHINLQSSESVRLLSGVQFNLNKDRKVQTYFGAALDYEFSGKADTYIKGLKADGAHLKGLTGILELGLSSKQSDTLTLDLSLQGYVGKKQGLGGTLALSKQF